MFWAAFPSVGDAASSTLASSLAEGSGEEAGAVVWTALGLELVLVSPPDLAICDEHAMMLPIAARARQAATVVLSLNMGFSLGVVCTHYRLAPLWPQSPRKSKLISNLSFQPVTPCPAPYAENPWFFGIEPTVPCLQGAFQEQETEIAISSFKVLESRHE
jgi:hypothetical protein